MNALFTFQGIISSSISIDGKSTTNDITAISVVQVEAIETVKPAPMRHNKEQKKPLRVKDGDRLLLDLTCTIPTIYNKS